MRSPVAEELGRETAETVRTMSPADRMALALKLGDRALRTFAEARGISRAEALRMIQARDQHGRRYSRCTEELDGDVTQ